MKNTVSAGERKALMAKFGEVADRINRVVDEYGDRYEFTINNGYHILENLDHVEFLVWLKVDDDRHAIRLTPEVFEEGNDYYWPWLECDKKRFLTLENLEKAGDVLENSIRTKMSDIEGLIAEYHHNKDSEDLDI